MPIPAGTLATLRADFGGTIADWVASSAGGAIRFGSATLTFWDSPTGGNRYTDLVLGVESVDSVHVGIDGKIPMFQGPPGVTAMWVDAGQDRVLMNSADYASDYAAAAGSSAAQAQVAAAAAVAVGSTNDTIVAGLLGGASAARAAGDARWVTPAAGDARWVSLANRPVALRDNDDIDFTNTTDSSAALQTFITDAGAGTPIEFGRPGVIRCDSGFSLLAFQQLDGGASYLGAGGTAPGELRFTNIGSTGVGITGYPSGNNVLRNLLIRGPMTGAGSTTGFLSASGSPVFHAVHFYGWAIGCSLTAAYYAKFFDQCEWSGNKTGLINSGCFDQDHHSSRFSCLYNGSSLGVAIDGAARGMNLHGGSLENYSASGAVKMYSNQVLNPTKTYFESSSSGSSAFGIVAAGIDKATVNPRGCMVILTEHNRWLHMSGSTNMIVNADGNIFVCPTTSSTSPIAYYLAAGDVGNVKGRIGYDNWAEVVKSGALYVPASLSNLGQVPDLDYRLPGMSYFGGDLAGNGSPENVVPGRPGARYRRLDGGAGTCSYTKESGTGTTGWVAK